MAVKFGRESAVPPLECCLQVPIALSGPRFVVVKRGEVVQKRLEALPARFPSVIVSLMQNASLLIKSD